MSNRREEIRINFYIVLVFNPKKKRFEQYESRFFANQVLAKEYVKSNLTQAHIPKIVEIRPD